MLSVFHNERKKKGMNNMNFSYSDVVENLRLMQKSIIELGEKVDAVSKQLDEIKKVSSKTVDKCNVDILEILRNKKIEKINEIFKDKNIDDEKKYPLMSRIGFDIDYEIKRQFGIKRLNNLKSNQLGRATEIIKNYKPTIAMKEEIETLNSQMSF